MTHQFFTFDYFKELQPILTSEWHVKYLFGGKNIQPLTGTFKWKTQLEEKNVLGESQFCIQQFGTKFDNSVLFINLIPTALVLLIAQRQWFGLQYLCYLENPEKKSVPCFAQILIEAVSFFANLIIGFDFTKKFLGSRCNIFLF